MYPIRHQAVNHQRIIYVDTRFICGIIGWNNYANLIYKQMKRKMIIVRKHNNNGVNNNNGLTIERTGLGKATSRARMTNSRPSIGSKFRHTSLAASTKLSYPLFSFLRPVFIIILLLLSIAHTLKCFHWSSKG